MNPVVICFGEILWDCLPRGLFLGGAPYNVAYHVQKQGCQALFVSAVGTDTLGEEAVRRVTDSGITDAYIARLPEWRTGYVRVELDEKRNATYEIAEPVAWDWIPANDALVKRAETADAFVYGSLAQRGENNRNQLKRLLSATRGLKIMDVNLRPPFDNRDQVLSLARSADILKLNDDEVFQLIAQQPQDSKLEPAVETLANISGVKRICVTRGENGALFWNQGSVQHAKTPKVQVRDTVGAGDAFMASLTAAAARGELDDPKNDGAWLTRACRIGALVASKEGATPDYDPE